jgi:hypothetical protein
MARVYSSFSEFWHFRVFSDLENAHLRNVMTGPALVFVYAGLQQKKGRARKHKKGMIF